MTEHEMLQFGGELFQIRRKPRFGGIRLKLEVFGPGRITVSPSRTHAEIIGFLTERRVWIAKVRAKFAVIKETVPDPKMRDGEIFPLHGCPHVLRIEDHGGKRVLTEAKEGVIRMRTPSSADMKVLKQALQKFYRRTGEDLLKESVDYFSKILDLRPKQLTFRNQKTRWGSCSPTGTISLNWRLAAAPIEVLDYVVVHELCHLRHHNHSPAFWALVRNTLPDFKQQKDWLRQNQFNLDFLGNETWNMI